MLLLLLLLSMHHFIDPSSRLIDDYLLHRRPCHFHHCLSALIPRPLQSPAEWVGPCFGGDGFAHGLTAILPAEYACTVMSGALWDTH